MIEPNEIVNEAERLLGAVVLNQPPSNEDILAIGITGGRWQRFDHELKPNEQFCVAAWTYLVRELIDRAQSLEDAIKTHRSQKADDRCIEDDDRLYAVLGDGIKCDRRLGDKDAMLKNCARFIDQRCEGGGWLSYAELESLLAEHHTTTHLMDAASSPAKIAENIGEVCGLCSAAKAKVNCARFEREGYIELETRLQKVRENVEPKLREVAAMCHEVIMRTSDASLSRVNGLLVEALTSIDGKGYSEAVTWDCANCGQTNLYWSPQCLQCRYQRGYVVPGQYKSGTC